MPAFRVDYEERGESPSFGEVKRSEAVEILGLPFSRQVRYFPSRASANVVEGSRGRVEGGPCAESSWAGLEMNFPVPEIIAF